MWLWMTIRFAIYVLLLSPAFLRAAFIYTISDFIKKSIVYGKNRRNTLDLYLPNLNVTLHVSTWLHTGLPCTFNHLRVL